MTVQDFLQSYEDGQRHFSNLNFECEEGFSNKSFVDIIFENCFLYVDFRNSDLTNARFISCNIKEIDLRGANLTNASMTKCLVESAMFARSINTGFKFIENYYYGLVLGQDDFETWLKNSDSYLKEL